jgi:hypothetical protein
VPTYQIGDDNIKRIGGKKLAGASAISCELSGEGTSAPLGLCKAGKDDGEGRKSSAEAVFDGLGSSLGQEGAKGHPPQRTPPPLLVGYTGGTFP